MFSQVYQPIDFCITINYSIDHQTIYYELITNDYSLIYFQLSAFFPYIWLIKILIKLCNTMSLLSVQGRAVM
ncbi:hypothetical protein QF042_005099 [Pedobacter sp. W3I1]|nr:hypothetical protein [Pedobacter sp. W3I1]